MYVYVHFLFRKSVRNKMIVYMAMFVKRILSACHFKQIVQDIYEYVVSVI